MFGLKYILCEEKIRASSRLPLHVTKFDHRMSVLLQLVRVKRLHKIYRLTGNLT